MIKHGVLGRLLAAKAFFNSLPPSKRGCVITDAACPTPAAPNCLLSSISGNGYGLARPSAKRRPSALLHGTAPVARDDEAGDRQFRYYNYFTSPA